jgi:hypothetical protein
MKAAVAPLALSALLLCRAAGALGDDAPAAAPAQGPRGGSSGAAPGAGSEPADDSAAPAAPESEDAPFSSIPDPYAHDPYEPGLSKTSTPREVRRG